jgi:hypothetical protein
MNKTLTIFGHKLYLVEILLVVGCYLFTEGVFSWLLIPSSGISAIYSKTISIVITAYTIFQFRYLDKTEKIFIGIFAALMVKLIFESLFTYQLIFKQFTIFTVIYPVVFTIFIKILLRRYDLDILGFIAKFYLFIYFIFMLVYGRGFSFGLQEVELQDYGPFSGDSRIIHARSILMMIIPLLWYLNRYLRTRKLGNLVWVVCCCIIILVHQHRSVWGSALFAMAIFFVLTMVSNRSVSVAWSRLFLMLLPLILLAYVYAAALYPNLMHFFSERFSEIMDPSREGSTGNFRIEQTQVYLQYISQKPIFGWSFAGFDLQNPLVDWWDEGTGQHFHEGFIEILFYHGIVGLLLKYGLLVLVIIKSFSKKLSDEAVVLIPFCLCGLIFSLSYVLPVVFWGHVGMCLYYLDKIPSRA